MRKKLLALGVVALLLAATGYADNMGGADPPNGDLPPNSTGVMYDQTTGTPINISTGPDLDGDGMADWAMFHVPLPHPFWGWHSMWAIPDGPGYYKWTEWEGRDWITPPPPGGEMGQEFYMVTDPLQNLFCAITDWDCVPSPQVHSWYGPVAWN